MGNEATVGEPTLRDRVLNVLAAHFKKEVRGEDVFGASLPIDEQDSPEIHLELGNELNMDIPDLPYDLSDMSVDELIGIAERTHAEKLPINTF